MRKSRFFWMCAITACVSLSVGVSSALATFEGVSRSQDQAKQPKVSDAENKALKKIDDTKDPAAKIQAAAEFIKKYPKSEARRNLAEHVAGTIGAVADAGQRITLVQSYLATFTGPGEADLVTRALLNAYISAGRTEDAFREGAVWLQKNPEDVETMWQLAVSAGNAAIAGNKAFVAQGQQYGQKAAELIEADKKPAGMDPTKWTEYKTVHLPAIYREVGVLAMRAGDRVAVKTNMEKAAALKSSDPVVYMLLSDLANEEYTQVAKKYQAMPAGPEKAEERKRVDEKMDRVIDLYAQTVALSEGNPQLATAGQELRKDLETYYKHRHNGSTEGLQQLIDKYKKPTGSQ
jgi:hypothetical protein